MSDYALGDQGIAAAFMKQCTKAELKLDADKLVAVINQADADPKLTSIALDSLKLSMPASFNKVLNNIIQDVDKVPTEWFKFLADADADTALTFAKRVLASDTSLDRKRGSIRLLGKMGASEIATPVLSKLIEGVKDESLEPELRLDAIQAAENSKNPALLSSLKSFYISTDDKPVISYAYALVGGDAENGGKIFNERTELSCLRCHMIGTNGGNVGPNLSEIGKLKTRQYILESIANPNKSIADGFSEQIILTSEGTIVTGIKKDEDENSVTLLDKDGISIRVAKEAIDQQKTGQSSMPTDLIEKISVSDLRDLVEFLSTQKTKPLETTGAAGH